MAKARNCASLGLAFTAIGLFFMLLWASSGQAVPASVENLLSENAVIAVKAAETETSATAFINRRNCSTLDNQLLCKYFDDIVPNRMKHRLNINEKPAINSSKNTYEPRLVRSLESNNSFTKSKFPNDKKTFSSYDAKTSFDLHGNILFAKELQGMNNGGSVSMGNISDTTLANLKESDAKGRVEKEASDKINLNVNGE